MKFLRISEDLQLRLDDVVGKFIAILGIRGSGKTNTAAVLLEELLRFNFPLTIVDIDGEYWGLKEKYEILVVGKSENVDVEIDVEHAEQIAEVSISKNVPVILDVSGFLYEDTYKLLLNYFKRIWDLAGKYRKPYEIVLEEAHEFIPQGIRTDLKEVLVKIALRGRKRGLGAIVVSQRSAKVEKDALTQAEILFLHKVVHPSDLKVYKEILPLPPKDVVSLVSSLDIGECIFYYGETCKSIRVRLRETFHAGYTPTLGEVKSPTLKTISEEIIKSIKELTASKKKKMDKIERLIREINDLKAELREKEKIIQRLNEELEILRKIKVEIEPSAILGLIESNIEGIGTIKTNKEPKSEFEYLPKEVREHVKRLLHRLNKLPKPEKEMLKFLIIREPEEYTYDQIAEWIGYSLSTLYSNTPKKLIKLGIITRSRRGGRYYFKSNFNKFIEKEFEIYQPKICDDDLKSIKNYIKSQLIV